MTDPLLTSQKEDLPTANIEQQSRFSLIWVIPLVAALIGGWLMVKIYTEKGEEIILTFDRAEGIEIKKTPVRYKDVTVGKVTNIRLDSSLEKVLIYVEIVPSMAEHLGPESHFWVVRPRVSVKGISGLTTLLSGIHIGMDPGDKGEPKSIYKGLEDPPHITSYSTGSTFMLQADKLGSMDIGSPVYYRQLNVGEVINYKLNSDKDTVSLSVFVQAPYDKMVRQNSLFWNVSGVDVSMSPTGEMTARIESLTALLVGGIAFETPHNLEESLEVASETEFPLYDTHEAAKEQNKGERLYYIMNFEGSLAGLELNAIVEYKGITIGKVEDIHLQVDEDTDNIKIPVVISLYADMLTFDGDADETEDLMERLVEKGLRGQLSTSNYILGTQVVSLVFPDDEDLKPATIIASTENQQDYPEIPTIEGLGSQLASSAAEIVNQVRLGINDARKLINSPQVEKSTQKIADILDNTNKLLIEVKPQIISSLDELSGTLKNTRSISGKLNRETLPIANQMKKTMTKLDAALNEVRTTLKTANSTLGEDSAMQYELRLLIEEVSEAANSFSVLADTLQRKPNAVILGK